MQGFNSSESSSSWVDAWNIAQPRLAQIQQSLHSASPPDPRILRVGQLDAELLDQEIVHLLSEPLVKALSYVNVCILHISGLVLDLNITYI